MTSILQGYLVHLEDTDSFVSVSLHLFKNGRIRDDVEVDCLLKCSAPQISFSRIFSKSAMDISDARAIAELTSRLDQEAKLSYSMGLCQTIEEVEVHLQRRFEQLGVHSQNIPLYTEMICNHLAALA